MKKQPAILLCMVLAMAFVTAGAFGQEANEPPAGPDLAAIAQGLLSWDLWATVLFSVIFGAVGGVVYELLVLQGNIELPHKPTNLEVSDEPLFAIPKYMYDLGIFARVFIGGFAAVAAIWVLAPVTAFSALATAIVAGSAGTSIFRSVQDRLLSALAQKELADTKAKAKVQNNKVEQAQTVLAGLKGKIGKASNDAAPEALGPWSDAGVGQEDLDRLGTLLSEAKGAGDTIK